MTVPDQRAFVREAEERLMICGWSPSNAYDPMFNNPRLVLCAARRDGPKSRITAVTFRFPNHELTEHDYKSATYGLASDVEVRPALDFLSGRIYVDRFTPRPRKQVNFRRNGVWVAQYHPFLIQDLARAHEILLPLFAERLGISEIYDRLTAFLRCANEHYRQIGIS